MLIPYLAISGKQTYLTINNRGSDDELEVGGNTSGNYQPEAAETQTLSPTRGPEYQDTGKPGPGTIPMQYFFSPGTEAADKLSDLYLNGTPNVFNIYMGQQVGIYNAEADGVAAAKIVISTTSGKTTGTLTGGTPPWGDTKHYGSLSIGMTVQVGAALWSILGLEDENYNQATKLRLAPIDGAADVGTADDYRIFKSRQVMENFLATVVDASGFSWDTTSPLTTGTITIAPSTILAMGQWKKLAWDPNQPGA